MVHSVLPFNTFVCLCSSSHCEMSALAGAVCLNDHACKIISNLSVGRHPVCNHGYHFSFFFVQQFLVCLVSLCNGQKVLVTSINQSINQSMREDL